MHRTRALAKTVLSSFNYRNGGNSIFKAGAPIRLLAIAPASVDAPTPGHSAENAASPRKDQDVDSSGAPFQQPSMDERRPVHWGTLQFLLQRRMPINSMRLLTAGVRMACEERRSEEMVPYLGPWLAQLTRPETLDRIMPWSICDILRDLTRLSRTVGQAAVRNALPPKHLQTLANRLVVQGFDKLTPLQLARAADGFAMFRPWVSRATFDQTALDTGTGESTQAPPVWPSSDWVDELVDWLHNLKPNNEPWPRTSSYSLSVILLGLARSNYKPRQPTMQAAATAMKAKLEEQIQTGYYSRSALSNAAIAWNIWRVNPDEYAPGYWDVYFKAASQVLEEYVDTAPDPPSIEDDVVDVAVDEEQGEKFVGRRRLPRNSPSLMSKRRELRALLATIVLATKNFDLTKQFDESVKAIWEQRIDEHALFMTGQNARRVLLSCDNLGITLKPQTREKLMGASSKYGGGKQNTPREGAGGDVDDFDDLRGSARGGNRGVATDAAGGARGPAARNDSFDDYDDFRPSAGGGGGAGRAPRSDRGGGRARRGDDFAFDEKPF